MHTITFHDLTLHLEPDTQHEFLLTNKEVALGYGISLQTINDHKNKLHSDELIEGKHWIKKATATNGGKQKVIYWTKKGIVRLGFFIKSKKAKEFRDWAEDYIVNEKSNTTKLELPSNQAQQKIEELQQVILEQNKLLAQSHYCATSSEFSKILDKIHTELYRQADRAIVLAHQELTNLLAEKR